MANFIVLVLDGFGIGFQSDVETVRPGDMGANTLKHLIKSQPSLKLPNLERLGLMNAAGFESAKMKFSPRATFGRSELKHFGADTFWGHQEIMGTLPRKSTAASMSLYVNEIKNALEEAGHEVRIVTGDNSGRFLIVDNVMTVADNIETDPGLAVNVTSALDFVSFEEVIAVGKIVRSIVPVSRVIVFGGSDVTIEKILAAVEEKENGFIGINAPKSGVYLKDYQAVHIGYQVDPDVQIPGILHKSGIPTVLIGKVADIVLNPVASNSFPMVPTEEVMKILIDQVQKHDLAFICANVQETDLTGHRENPEAYIEVLTIADRYLGKLLETIGEDDILIVMADHGNDPCIGHTHHTREMVPLLLAGSVLDGIEIGTRATLSDVAATAASFFGVSTTENGESFLEDIIEPGKDAPSGALIQRIELMCQHGILGKEEEGAVRNLIRFFDDQFKIVLDEENSAPFVTHFAMLLNRLGKGENINPMASEICESLTLERHFEVAKETAERIRSEIAYFPPEENGYILAHLIHLFDKMDPDFNTFLKAN